MKELLSPSLYCPFPHQINKHVDILQEYALEWVLRFNLQASETAFARLSKSKFFLLAASAYPNCDLEELKIGNDWLSWVFIWDDQCDMSEFKKQPEALKIFQQRFIEILKGSEPTSQDMPINHALADLRQRTRQRTNEKWFNHFLHCFEQYCHGCVEEAAIRAQGIVPDIDTYMKCRRFSVGGYLFLTVSEFCNQFMLSDVLRNHEIVKKLELLTIDILAWCNDVFSASREMESGDVHNLVLVLHYLQTIPLNEAINLAASMHNKKVKELINLEASIPSFGEEIDVEMAKYISIMHSWISGNLNWYSLTGRYETTEKLELVNC
ncbi:terpene synthase family protein [Desmonostoc muscorum LEGE 12446]|uniref:Terpene synthase n=1 Tax=Desmonostoc muscorum LEGE 12446 TaxID=1828758 RepID=A0A8J6ZJ05_DESMC|nr:terpene synthase family protein [Desmonostoc muscorum]MCF2147000.1 terpene synthase family protein [Desmonostoc muscorum LEGE 12446]